MNIWLLVRFEKVEILQIDKPIRREKPLYGFIIKEDNAFRPNLIRTIQTSLVSGTCDTWTMTLKRPSTISRSYRDTFNSVNERVVEDISLEFFYKPHTITLLAVSIAAVVYSSFIR